MYASTSDVNACRKPQKTIIRMLKHIITKYLRHNATIHAKYTVANLQTIKTDSKKVIYHVDLEKIHAYTAAHTCNCVVMTNTL